MPRDINLRLANKATPITATGFGAAVDTEGGFFARVSLAGGVITDADETFTCVVQASRDGGTNYRNIGAFPQIVATDDNVDIARPVWVPKVASGQTVTKVRLSWTVVGTTPSNAIDAFLEPLLSLASLQTDADLQVGVEKLLST